MLSIVSAQSGIQVRNIAVPCVWERLGGGGGGLYGFQQDHDIDLASNAAQAFSLSACMQSRLIDSPTWPLLLEC